MPDEVRGTPRPASIIAGERHSRHAQSAIHIQLLHVPDCQRVDRVRAALKSVLAKTSVRMAFEDIEGPYPSPTLLINGIDVTGRRRDPGPSCRLDLPTEDDIVVALRAIPVKVEAP
jgi:hypothetical protein